MYLTFIFLRFSELSLVADAVIFEGRI